MHLKTKQEGQCVPVNYSVCLSDDPGRVSVPTRVTLNVSYYIRSVHSVYVSMYTRAVSSACFLPLIHSLTHESPCIDAAAQTETEQLPERESPPGSTLRCVRSAEPALFLSSHTLNYLSPA